VAKINEAEVDRDLLGVARPCSQLMYVSGHLFTIHLASIWMLYGW
jgi:hypothetical protein